MQSFLSHVVSEVLLKVNTPLQQIKFVVPSQRAGVFLKHELIAQLSNANFLPKIISIENYIQEIADISQIDSIQLLFEFYTIYIKNTEKDKLDSFDSFSQWATIVLQDFNEIDSHLIDSKDLFDYLRDINRLNNWTPNTQLTKNYFSFFEKLKLYYDSFYSYLQEKKVGYQGLIYREAESNIQHYIKTNQNIHIVFVGFNALNRAEEHIFQELLQSELASIYWDADDTYLNGVNETGMFLRKYKQTWPYYKKENFKWTYNHLNSTPKNINVIGAPKNVSQLKFVAELLDKQKDYHKTALVLADESLLSLTLNSLPNRVEKINITMGFSLKEIPFSNFFNAIFKLYLNQEKLQLKDKKLFYYKDIIVILNHPYFNILSDNSIDFKAEINRKNLIFLPIENLTELFENDDANELTTILFGCKIDSIENLIDSFIKIIQLYKFKVEGIEREYLYRFYTIFQQLKTLNNTFGHIDSLKTLHQLFNQLLQNEKLSFQGEPLEGLQLMGMLETRAIDFETVIITSLNEGILPASKSDKSFIPFDVKKQFNLPTFQEKDAIFSYHFYRLLHRAKNIYLIYNTEKDVYGTGEKSRFLTQLGFQRKDINHFITNPKVNMKLAKLQIVSKSDALYTKLIELASTGISPSSLATYINNPIDFYYQKILKIKEMDEVEETVAINTMGTVIHETLEQLYKPFIQKHLTVEILKQMLLLSNKIIVSKFEKIYENGDMSRGKNKLIFEVSKKYLERFLKQELQEIKSGKQIKIIALEQKLSCNLKIEGIPFPLKISGIIDRVDEVDGTIRILDYKTGMVKSTELKISDFSILKEGYKYTKALQVMLYTYLYSVENQFDFSNNLEAGIVSFKNLNNGFLKMNFGEGYKKDYTITQEKMNAFMTELKEIILEIYNKEIPFKENPNKAF